MNMCVVILVARVLSVIIMNIGFLMSHVFAQTEEIRPGLVQQISIAFGSSNPTNAKFFDPDLVSISTGSVVNWTNNDESFHTVTFLTESGFDSGIIPPGNSSSHQFPNQGIFNYQCKIHPYMLGELRIS